MSSHPHDVAVIGGGIVGLATARAILGSTRATVIVLEAERELARHQTGHNSGVIHSGLYYRPGSLKARNCTAGRERMYRFCERHGIPHERCGKLVVATAADEIPRLEELERRGRVNGLSGVKRLAPEQLTEHEPHVAGVAGLLVPETGIVDYAAVAAAMARDVEAREGTIRTAARVLKLHRSNGHFVLESSGGDFAARALINCAGLHSDRVARMCGVDPPVRIVPFRGEYHALRPESRRLVRNLIYPVPDPRFPFLGVHFTRMIDGAVEAGPNAVLAFKREGYARWSFSARDMLETVAFGGFHRMAARHWRIGIAEWRRSLSRAALVRDLRRLIPELSPADVEPHGAGVRAQAVSRDGRIVDDFVIDEAAGQLHVLNAPSPAATASLSIGSTLAVRARHRFDLSPRAD